MPYFHVVYTLPSELRDIAYQNKRVVYDLLMKAAAETTLAIAADPKRLGARIGVTAVLHTWGSALTHHPHVHMIVPGGGFSLDKARWVLSRSNFRACQLHPGRLYSRCPRRLRRHCRSVNSASDGRLRAALHIPGPGRLSDRRSPNGSMGRCPCTGFGLFSGGKRHSHYILFEQIE